MEQVEQNLTIKLRIHGEQHGDKMDIFLSKELVMEKENAVFKWLLRIH